MTLAMVTGKKDKQSDLGMVTCYKRQEIIKVANTAVVFITAVLVLSKKLLIWFVVQLDNQTGLEVLWVLHIDVV